MEFGAMCGLTGVWQLTKVTWQPNTASVDASSKYSPTYPQLTLNVGIRINSRRGPLMNLLTAPGCT